MRLPRPTSRPVMGIVAAMIAVLLAGCGGSTPTMHPRVGSEQVEGETATSCAGDVCFTYAAER